MAILSPLAESLKSIYNNSKLRLSYSIQISQPLLKEESRKQQLNVICDGYYELECSFDWDYNKSFKV